MEEIHKSVVPAPNPAEKAVKVTCLGSGFVGGPMSAIMAYMSNLDVTVVDVNHDRIAAWNSSALPVYEPGLDFIVSSARDRLQSLHFSTDIDKAIDEAEIIFVCVNTPTKSNGIGKGAGADLSYVEAATRAIAKVATAHKIVIEKSTVPCRTAESIREILSANAKPGVRFDVLSNPEFLAEGTAVEDLLRPERIIIGSMPTPSGRQAAKVLVDIYSHWVPRDRIITMNLWSAELSKLAANAMLAQRISSVNALSAICEATGANVEEVSHACGLDSRIGPGMLKAGPGFGGSCFQKDIFNIVYLSESLHLYEVAEYWRAIIKMNEYQKERFTKRIITCLHHNVSGKKIAILGFAFKKNTSDTRESPAITLVRNLVAERAQIAIYDPKVKEEQIGVDLLDDGLDATALTTYVKVCVSAYAACEAADAVVVITEWDEFSNKTEITPVQISGKIDVLRVKDANTRLPSKSLLHAQEPGAFAKLNSLFIPKGTEKIRELLAGDSIHMIGPTISNLPDHRLALDWKRIAEHMRKPRYVFDGRNILDASKLESLGFRVEAIGRATSYGPAPYEIN